MSEFFLTNPDNQDDEDRVVKPKVKGSASIRFKEAVAVELQHLQVPKETSEIAVIDNRFMWLPFYHKKESPRQAAIYMLATVEKIYKTDGKWHYN